MSSVLLHVVFRVGVTSDFYPLAEIQHCTASRLILKKSRYCRMLMLHYLPPLLRKGNDVQITTNCSSLILIHLTYVKRL